MRLFSRVFADDRERNLTRLDVLQAFTAGNEFAIWGKNRGDADDVARGDAGVSERQLEARKPFTMFTDAFGEEYLLRNERHGAGLPCLREWVEPEKIFPLWKSNKKVFECQSLSRLRIGKNERL